MTDKKEIELKFYAEHGKEAIDTISYSSVVFPCHFLTNKTKDNFKSGRSINYYTGILNDIAMPTNKYDYYRLIIGAICMGNWLGFTPLYGFCITMARIGATQGSMLMSIARLSQC